MPGNSRGLSPMAIAILELLHERPMHPYEMRRVMRERGASERVRTSAGALYHTINRLTEDALVEVVETEREGNRPERTVYAITGAGRDRFAADALEELSVPRVEYPRYPLALGALADLPREEAIAALRQRLVHLDSALSTADLVRRTHEEREVPPLCVVDYDYETHMRRAEREWTARLLDDIEAGRLTWPTRTTDKGDDDDER